MKSLHCPTCGAGVSDPRATACTYCHTAFRPQQPLVVKIVLLGMVVPNWRAMLKIWAGVAVCAVGFAAYAAKRSDQRLYATVKQAQEKIFTEDNTILEDVMDRHPMVLLDATFTLRSTEKSKSGDLLLSGDVRSTSIEAITAPKITAVFFDSAGNEAATATAYAAKGLKPGEATPVVIRTTAVAYKTVKFDVEVHALKAPPTPNSAR